MWRKAIHTELTAISENKVWGIIENPGNVELLSIKRVFREKDNCTNKARLVVRGSEDSRSFHFADIFAPVALLQIIRLFILLSFQKNCPIRQFHVRNAFLNGTLSNPVS